MTDFTPEDYIKYRIDRAKETIEEVRVISTTDFGTLL